MTTDQSIDESAAAGEAALDAAADTARKQVEDASRELLAKARYDAFKLMTEASQEAETILDEARAEAAGTVKAAQLTAESTATKAKSGAEATLLAAQEEAAVIVARAHRTAGEVSPEENSSTVQAEHRALSERVSTLRTLADQLEDRFAALAETAATLPEDLEAPPAAPQADSANPELDHEPAVAPSPKKEETTGFDPPLEERDSYYNRRSANLPRLGDDGGRSAFEMTRSMREALDTE
ncbi:MAG: hypothetical protein BMS9Abin12_1172 [Acidimicrobiia bacterium]|nr:MAG: hypothetical protein BMS9Abin12_1172 [Acidimicrobiia bacterium]